MAEHVNKLDAKYQGYSKVYPKHAIDTVDAILAVPSGNPRRWRMSAAVWINQNVRDADSGLLPIEEYIEVTKQLKEKRANLTTKFAEVGDKRGERVVNSGLREMLEVPAGMMTYIEMFDPVAFDSNNPDRKNNFKKLAREFKEFAVGVQ